MVLQVIGLNDKIINLILFCVSFVALSIFWDRENLAAFTPQRSLR